MKRFLSLALTFALLSTFCLSALAAAGPVQANDGHVSFDGSDPSTEVYTVGAETDTEINSTVMIRSGNAHTDKLEVIIEDPIVCVDKPCVQVYPSSKVETNVSILDDVSTGGDSNGIATYAGGDANVTMTGDVNAPWALYLKATGTVQVDGDLNGTKTGVISYTGDLDVFVDGDVTGDGYAAVYLHDVTTLGIDGEVDGPMVYVRSSASDDAVVAFGSLTERTELTEKAPDTVRFLIGTDDSSDVSMDDITLSGSAVSGKTLTGIDDKLYGTTNTVNELANAGDVEVTLKSGKAIKSVSGMGDGITATVNDNGTATLKFKGDGFLGGLNKLIIKLGDLLKPAAKKTAPTVKAETVGVQGEGAEAFNAEQRAGFKVSAEFIERNGSEAQILLGDEEIPSGFFAVVTLPDGSVGVLFSNTFMASLGAGEHVFRVVVGGAEFNVTVNVEAL